MVQPINYSRDVLSPIEGYLQGLKFGEGLNTERQQQQATAQNMGIQRESMDLQQQQFAAQQQAAAQQRADQQAAAAQQRQQAEQGSMALMSYLDALEQGTASPADLRKGIAMFPQLADQFQTFASSVSEERLNNELQFGQQLSFALANDNTDAAENLLRTRQQAAEASGDEQTAAVAKAQLMELKANPKGLLMQTLMPLASTMPSEKFDTFHDDILGLGGGGKPQSSIAKLQADLNAGLIDKSQYDLAVQNMAPKGMTIRSTPGGGFEMVQGAGVGADDGGLTPAAPEAMLSSIEGILADPALETSTGMLSVLQNVPGTSQRRFGARARQLEGQAFLQAFESLKGAGQITEIEGTKATQAIGRLDTAQAPEDYREALEELRDLLKVGIERGREQSAPSGPADDDAAFLKSLGLEP